MQRRIAILFAAVMLLATSASALVGDPLKLVATSASALVGDPLKLVATSASALVREPLKLVATIPDLADIAQAIGGERVSITTLCKGTENTHFVTAKPSHLVAMSRADALVEIGLSLEMAFVPGLLEQCRNDRLQPGKPGLINTSEGWKALDVPVVLDRKQGDVHPQGNPHMNLAPSGGRQMAERIFAGLCALDPSGKPEYQKRYDAWLAELAEAEKRWSALGAAWKGRKVVLYHKEFDYLAAEYGIDVLGSVEPKPGIAPTPGHIADLVERMRREKDVVLITAVWSNNKEVREIAERTGARVVELPNMCRGVPGTDTWIRMMDLVHQRIDAAFRPATPKEAKSGG
ncbi:MAG: zinc ABC transporter substrate-binding protein [Planctomycetes bacterium]|nr:zinc ABC transporter substrate-binding protein [Planctomycetota bacterium]